MSSEQSIKAYKQTETQHLVRHDEQGGFWGRGLFALDFFLQQHVKENGHCDCNYCCCVFWISWFGFFNTKQN